jgi:NAD(P)H-flavin reductase
MTNALIPSPGQVLDVRDEAVDIKTFRVMGTDGKKPFPHRPGQCAMVGLPGVGEAMFSVSSSPTDTDCYEFSIKRCGVLTDALHELTQGSLVAIRGPYGNGFPVDKLKGQNLLFVAGGIGLAPLRSVIRYCLANRADYGDIDIVYGARSKGDLVFLPEVENEWPTQPNTKVFLTIDRAEPEWSGTVGNVPTVVKQLKFDTNRTALVCGPPIMIKYAAIALKEMGFVESQVYTTMELRMKCGVGKCGRCNIGSKYVCKDGPVFRLDELSQLPEEY